MANSEVVLENDLQNDPSHQIHGPKGSYQPWDLSDGDFGNIEDYNYYRGCVLMMTNIAYI